MDRGRTRYEYDPAGQLLAVLPHQGRHEAFRYDPDGNVFEAPPGAPEREYGQGNRLLRIADAAYEWDDGGRPVRKIEHADGGKRTWEYAWNGAGLLAEVRTPDGRVIDFTYDPFSRRVAKRVREREGGAWKVVGETRFVWDGDALAHETRSAAAADGRSVTATRAYWFDDQSLAPIAHRDGSIDGSGARTYEWFYYLNDPSGAPELIVDGKGLGACELDRTVWGRTSRRDGARTSTPLRLQGQYEDEETGLAYNAYNWARYYDASPAGTSAETRSARSPASTGSPTEKIR